MARMWWILSSTRIVLRKFKSSSNVRRVIASFAWMTKDRPSDRNQWIVLMGHNMQSRTRQDAWWSLRFNPVKLLNSVNDGSREKYCREERRCCGGVQFSSSETDEIHALSTFTQYSVRGRDSIWQKHLTAWPTWQSGQADGLTYDTVTYRAQEREKLVAHICKRSDGSTSSAAHSLTWHHLDSSDRGYLLLGCKYCVLSAVHDVISKISASDPCIVSSNGIRKAVKRVVPSCPHGCESLLDV